MVRYYRVSLPVRFLPFRSSVTGAWSVKTVIGYPRIISLKCLRAQTIARVS